MDERVIEAAKELIHSKCTVALTGAGISVESGIPPFRGKGGLWEKIDPIEYAHIGSFLKDPAKIWNVLIKDMKGIIDQAKPNMAHQGLARLEEMNILKAVITQNVDGLHQAAGNTEVIEFHGTFARQRCLDCDRLIPTRNIDISQIPPKCACGGILRPDCVFFGESIPVEHLIRSRELSAECDIMLVVGTSGTVQPAASMPLIAKNSGGKIIEINPEETPLTPTVSDILLKGPAGSVFMKLLDEIERLS